MNIYMLFKPFPYGSHYINLLTFILDHTAYITIQLYDQIKIYATYLWYLNEVVLRYN
jgi:hypothetical protein